MTAWWGANGIGPGVHETLDSSLGWSPCPPEALMGALWAGLGQCVEPGGGNGQPVLRISLPDANTLEGLAQTLARLMVPAALVEQASNHLP